MPVLLFLTVLVASVSPSKLFAVEPNTRAKMIPLVCAKSAELEVQLENIRLLKKEMEKTLLAMNEAEIKKEKYHRVGRGMVKWGLAGVGASYVVGLYGLYRLVFKLKTDGMLVAGAGSAGLWAGLLTAGSGVVVVHVGGRKFRQLERKLNRAVIELSDLEEKMKKDWADLETLKLDLGWDKLEKPCKSE